jgi:hypothetical protein
MNWDIVGTIVVWGIVIYVFIALLRFFENNASNWQRLDRIEQMLQELTKKDMGEDKPKD